MSLGAWHRYSWMRCKYSLKYIFKKSLEGLLPDSILYRKKMGFGVPLVHWFKEDLVEYARKKNVYTASSTNGHFLDDETARDTVASGLDRLIISIDGITQQTYEAYRKEGSLEKVFEATSNVIRWKKKLRRRGLVVVWQFLA